MNTAPRMSIRNGRLIDPANGIDAICDLHLANGCVAAIGAAPIGFQAEQVLDASGCVVCPGLIDLATRLREPGYAAKATLAAETAAAAAGGITTLCCAPDTLPVIDTPAVAEWIRQRAERTGKARVLPIGALTRGLAGTQLSEMAALRDAGCVALSNGDLPLKNTLVARRVLEYAATFDLICLLHPLDHALRNQGCVHEGSVSARLGLPGIPEIAETVAIARDLELARYTKARVHFRGLSCAASVALFAGALQDPRLSADVAVHHLHLTEDDVATFNSQCHVIPPLRTHADREALRRAVAAGQIAAICSDHQPHEADAKIAPFPATAPGISGLETLLPLTLNLVAVGVLPLITALERLTWGPAQLLRLPWGRLEVGRAADICIFDPTERWIVNSNEFISSGHNTPFHGWSVKGRVRWTLLAGTVVFEHRTDFDCTVQELRG